MDKVSSREYELWQEWFKLDANSPSRTDHYLMQITQDIRGLFAKRRPKLDDCKIKFEWSDDDKPKGIGPNLMKAAKSVWFARSGYKGPK